MKSKLEGSKIFNGNLMKRGEELLSLSSREGTTIVAAEVVALMTV